MDIEQYNALKVCNYEKVALELADIARIAGSEAVYAAAYVLLRYEEDSSINLESVDTFIETANIDDARAIFIREMVGEVWRQVRIKQGEFAADELRALILFNESANAKLEADQTPAGVGALARKLMEIRHSDKVADFCTGRGSFIRDCYAECPDAHYYGNDINATMKEVAALRAEILGGDIRIEQSNVLDMGENSRQFDVAFANYPLGLRMRSQTSIVKASANAIWKRPEFARSASMDWIFNASVYNCIAGPRRAVCIMTNGSTWNTLDRAARKWFLENGSIETVIALPERIFENTNIATTMIVFSHGNYSVMMVDARDLCQKGRRLNVLTKEHVDEIVRCCREETSHSKRISFEEIAKNDYVINPIRFMDDEVAVSDGVPFETIIKKITRGAQISAMELDGLVSKEPTDNQYLMLSNIQDGIIDADLPYLLAIEKRQEKYCIKNNSLILSKNGAPFKVAVAEVPDGKKILANGNLYIIELDEDKANPYYIKAFLESDVGVAALRSIVVGATIPSIGVEQLKKIMVPCVPLKEQNAIAENYRAAIDEIKLLRRRMDKALDNLKHMFDAKGK